MIWSPWSGLPAWPWPVADDQGSRHWRPPQRCRRGTRSGGGGYASTNTRGCCHARPGAPPGPWPVDPLPLAPGTVGLLAPGTPPFTEEPPPDPPAFAGRGASVVGVAAEPLPVVPEPCADAPAPDRPAANCLASCPVTPAAVCMAPAVTAPATVTVAAATRPSGGTARHEPGPRDPATDEGEAEKGTEVWGLTHRANAMGGDCASQAETSR